MQTETLVPPPLVEEEIDPGFARLLASEPHARANPFPFWNKLRELAPLHHHGSLYLASRGRTVRQLLSDSRLGQNAFGRGSAARSVREQLNSTELDAYEVVTAFEAMYMSRTDGEVHARLRRIAQRTFTPRRIALLRERIEVTANALLDGLEKGEVTDLMPFAYRLPLIVIGEMLAIPDADLDMVHDWSSRLGRNRGGTDPVALMDAYKAMGEFRAYVEQRIAALRSQPTSGEDELSLLADLLDAEQGERLSTAELTAMFVVLLFAGHETTTNLIGSGMLAMLQHDQWARLCADPDLAQNATEELLRFVSPVQWTGRVTLEDVEVEGQVIPADTSVLLMLAAANRDPAVIPNPDRLDIGREGARNHVALGMGTHFCLGSPLARMEGEIAFKTLVRRFPDLRLADEALEWQGHAMLRGLARLPLVLGRDRG